MSKMVSREPKEDSAAELIITIDSDSSSDVTEIPIPQEIITISDSESCDGNSEAFEPEPQSGESQEPTETGPLPNAESTDSDEMEFVSNPYAREAANMWNPNQMERPWNATPSDLPDLDSLPNANIELLDPITIQNLSSASTLILDPDDVERVLEVSSEAAAPEVTIVNNSPIVIEDEDETEPSGEDESNGATGTNGVAKTNGAAETNRAAETNAAAEINGVAETNGDTATNGIGIEPNGWISKRSIAQEQIAEFQLAYEMYLESLFDDQNM